jgi:hypothetical protein
LPTERLEHTQQQAGGPHHQQSADLEKPASMGGVTRSSALSFGHGGLSATGQQAATSMPPYFFFIPTSIQLMPESLKYILVLQCTCSLFLVFLCHP